MSNRLLSVLGAVAILALILTACAPAAKPTPVAAPTQVPASPTPLPPAATPTPPKPTTAPTATVIPPTATSAAPTQAPPTPKPTAAATPAPTIIAESAKTTPTMSPGNNPLGLPIAKDAVDLSSDPDSGDIDYSSPSDIKTLVKFYRDALTAAGWLEDKDAAMVSDAVGSLDFTKGDASLSLAILSAGGDSKVTITTTGLQMAKATPGATNGTPASAPGSAALTAEDKDGLPVPSDYTEYVGETSTYRTGLTAVSPSKLKDVLALYRSELTARKWNELSATVGATDSKAILMFQNAAQAKLELKLAKNAQGGTDVSLMTKAEAAAKAAGIVAPAGKARIYFGNMTDAAVSFNINGNDMKVPPQNPSDNSMKNVPFVDLAPGKYDFTLTMTGKAPTKDQLEVGADETWGLLAGPGGALPLQMY